MAQGNAVTDARGTRQATVLFAPNTQATMVMPDGSTQPLTTLNVRATEYTVGPDGPARMPGPLPPTSGYTYAVELVSRRSARRRGREVTFNQPVPFYVDNFLDFPVGLQVPTAFYDRSKSAWVPIPDGRVIKIVSITAGLADIDSTGDGSVDNGVAIGMTDAERGTLAQTYAAGTTLWRVELTHFSPYDCNWPRLPPDDSVPPANPPPSGGEPPIGPRDEEGNCVSGNSAVECQQQRLRESISIAGTPFSLNYASDRVAGNSSGRTVIIPLSGATVPASLKAIRLEITIAGRVFRQEFPAGPNQRYTFTWDGMNAFAQQVTGGALAAIKIGYVYDSFYALPKSVTRSFGGVSGARVPGDILGPEMVFWQVEVLYLGDQPQGAIGGWSLMPHHVYDPTRGEFYFGDGKRRASRREAQKIQPIVELQGAYLRGGIAVAPDGAVVFVDGRVIRRKGLDGTTTTIAGTGNRGFSGDGGPATDADLESPSGLVIAPDGAIVFADGTRLRRIAPDGIITRIAGTGNLGFSGDGGPATAADLSVQFVQYPGAVAVAPDGSVIFADGWRIRRIAPDGIINTIAGTGDYGFSGDGGPATAADLTEVFGFAVTPDGGIIFANFGRIRRIDPNGIITTIAGRGSLGAGFEFGGDGGPATDALLSNQPYDVAAAADGTVVFVDGSRIRAIAPERDHHHNRGHRRLWVHWGRRAGKGCKDVANRCRRDPRWRGNS